MSGPAGPAVLLPDPRARADLVTFAGRAARADPGGAARLVGHGQVLAVYVSPLPDLPGITVLGLRTVALAEPSTLDVTVPLAALSWSEPGPQPDRGEESGRGEESDRGEGSGRGEGPGRGNGVGRGEGLAEGPVPLTLPATAVTVAGWAGVLPPRRGWAPAGWLEPGQVRAVAAEGAAEIRAATRPGADRPALSRVRAEVWRRPLLSGSDPAPDPDPAPAGLAFAAEVLGFLDDREPVTLYRAGPWTRLSTPRGHALARIPLLA